MWLGLPVAAFVIAFLRLIGITREDDRTLVEICIKPVGYPHFLSGADWPAYAINCSSQRESSKLSTYAEKVYQHCGCRYCVCLWSRGSPESRATCSFSRSHFRLAGPLGAHCSSGNL